MSGRPLKEGDLVVLVDAKNRQYLRTLQQGRSASLREHKLIHDQIIGMSEGSLVSRTEKDYLIVFRPTLAEYTLKMPRGAQVIYPKDAAMILIWADIFPGARVVEAGTGSGALTMALLRAVGEKGIVISYEQKPEFAKLALTNIQKFLGPCPNLVLKEADIYLGIEERDVDRIILDLTQPWQVVPHGAQALREGGIFLTFSPHVSQSQMTVQALKESGQFLVKETVELLLRPWVISERVNRPAHRMVAHTGFVTVARKLTKMGSGFEPDPGGGAAFLY